MHLAPPTLLFFLTLVTGPRSLSLAGGVFLMSELPTTHLIRVGGWDLRFPPCLQGYLAHEKMPPTLGWP